MNRRSGSGSGIFLMEMMVVVFFFMLCASTCILAFAKSDRMSRLAWERDHAVSAAQTVAETWKLDKEPETTKEASNVHYWDAGWEEISEPSGAAYLAEVKEESGQDGMKKLQIVVWEAGAQGEELFTLEAAKYVRPSK